MLRRDNRNQQLVYYQVSLHSISFSLYHRAQVSRQAGIGTYNIPEIAKPWMAKLSRTVDMMIGIHLNAHIMGTYYSLCLVWLIN